MSENRFARADLEHIHLMIDDDMRMEALKQTNYVKSIVTAQDKMDLEKKGKQSYQGWIMRVCWRSPTAICNLYTTEATASIAASLSLTTKEKPAARQDDPDIAEKMCRELEGIFLWAFAGLQRLVRNQFRFSESKRAKGNRDVVKQDANNVILFMESTQYVELNRTNPSAQRNCTPFTRSGVKKMPFRRLNPELSVIFWLAARKNTA